MKNKILLEGELSIPLTATAIVIFSHGRIHARMNAANRIIAHYLQQKNIGTLLFDLLTADEEMQFYNRYDIDLLTKRLIAATEWLEMEPAAVDCRLGYFGEDTGTAAALKAAAFIPQIGAIVSRSGRPDLATDILEDIEIPTLLLVGSLDKEAVKLNQQALNNLIGEKKLELVEGAGQLYEEPGSMEMVCKLSSDWFVNHLQPVLPE